MREVWWVVTDFDKCDHPEWSPLEGYMVCRTCDAIATFNPLTREWKIERLAKPHE